MICTNSGRLVGGTMGRLEAFKRHSKNALAVDKPVGGLLEDLDRRGLLDETVVFASEFGGPWVTRWHGTGHHIFGFSVWMAGGGIRGELPMVRRMRLAFMRLMGTTSLMCMRRLCTSWDLIRENWNSRA